MDLFVRLSGLSNRKKKGGKKDPQSELTPIFFLEGVSYSVFDENIVRPADSFQETQLVFSGALYRSAAVFFQPRPLFKTMEDSGLGHSW